MLYLSNFAERLKELMIENDLTASIIADKLRIDKSTVSKYLSQERAPSIENAIKLANFFDCTLDFMLGLVDENIKKDFKHCPQFSERLQFLFINKGKTKYALKKQTNISQSLLYYWLHDIYSPSVDNVIKLSDFFNCSVDYVLGRVDY